jgi:hypothetical protein
MPGKGRPVQKGISGNPGVVARRCWAMCRTLHASNRPMRSTRSRTSCETLTRPQLRELLPPMRYSIVATGKSWQQSQ